MVWSEVHLIYLFINFFFFGDVQTCEELGGIKSSFWQIVRLYSQNSGSKGKK
jgi:hypothetical protein